MLPKLTCLVAVNMIWNWTGSCWRILRRPPAAHQDAKVTQKLRKSYVRSAPNLEAAKSYNVLLADPTTWKSRKSHAKVTQRLCSDLLDGPAEFFSRRM